MAMVIWLNYFNRFLIFILLKFYKFFNLCINIYLIMYTLIYIIQLIDLTNGFIIQDVVPFVNKKINYEET